jgi:hypothetical protein
VVQIILIVIFSSVKFAMTFPLAVLEFQFGFFKTILWTNVGGIAGIYFFAYLSRILIDWWNRTFGKRKRKVPDEKRNTKKVFTKRNRRIVRIKQRYGLPGIAITTPFLLSIPVGTFLVVRYYHLVKAKFLYLILSNVVWSVIYTGFYFFWDDLLFERV